MDTSVTVGAVVVVAVAVCVLTTVDVTVAVVVCMLTTVDVTVEPVCVLTAVEVMVSVVDVETRSNLHVASPIPSKYS